MNWERTYFLSLILPTNWSSSIFLYCAALQNRQKQQPMSLYRTEMNETQSNREATESRSRQQTTGIKRQREMERTRRKRTRKWANKRTSLSALVVHSKTLWCTPPVTLVEQATVCLTGTLNLAIVEAKLLLQEDHYYKAKID